MEITLQPGPHRPVIRIGNTVRRVPGWWTPAVHDVLGYLNDNGFPYAPKPLGFDELGREILSYIDGKSGRDGWFAILSEKGLTSLARLLREYHDAIAGYQPSEDTEWAFGKMPIQDGHIICHGDFATWNVVWRGGTPVGLLDWDFIYPGSPLDDVAFALEYSVPFRPDDVAKRWHHFPEPPDRPRRLEVFAAAYGLTSTDGLVDAVIARQRKTVQFSRYLHDRGLVAPWTTTPSLRENEALAKWTENNRELFSQ